MKAKVNETAMVQFAKSYAPDVEILEPLELRDQVKKELKKDTRRIKIELCDKRYTWLLRSVY